jgi:hypothetical protein
VIRIEIIANHSVEENILEAFQREKVAAYYTKFPGVLGVGSSGPRMGDAVWPEENFVIVVWCEESEADGVERAVADVKKYFPEEGVKLFKLRDAPVTQTVYLPPAVLPESPARTESIPPPPPPKSKKTFSGPEKENL